MDKIWIPYASESAHLDNDFGKAVYTTKEKAIEVLKKEFKYREGYWLNLTIIGNNNRFVIYQFTFENKKYYIGTALVPVIE